MDLLDRASTKSALADNDTLAGWRERNHASGVAEGGSGAFVNEIWGGLV